MIDSEIILYSSYIKYDRLVGIINSAFKDSSDENLNIYIDLYSVLKPLYNSNIEIKDYTVVTASIINMCAHYREFFRTRYKTETNIYLVYSKNCCSINKQFVSGYNSNFKLKYQSNKLIDDMIIQNINLLKLICPYIKQIYFIDSDFEVGVIIYDLIKNDKKKYPNMIITKDKYNYQLAQLDKTIIIRPKKFNNDDISYYMDKNNIIESYLNEKKIKYRPSIKLHPSLFSLILSLSGLKERNVKSIYNISKSIKLIEKGIQSFQILNDYNYDIQSLTGSIYINAKDINLNVSTLAFRYKALDIPFLYSIYINTIEYKKLNQKIIDLYDPETVKMISNKYFIKYPLHLNEL